MNEVSEKVDRAAAAVQGFRERALEINKTVDFITSIAQETHLLALNATIEAARAASTAAGSRSSRRRSASSPRTRAGSRSRSRPWRRTSTRGREASCGR